MVGKRIVLHGHHDGGAHGAGGTSAHRIHGDENGAFHGGHGLIDGLGRPELLKTDADQVLTHRCNHHLWVRHIASPPTLHEWET